MSESSRSSRSWNWGRVLLVVVCLVVGVAAGVAYYTQAPKAYEATATVLVLPTATGLDSGATIASAEINMETEAELARSVSVATEVSGALDGALSAGDLTADGAVSVPPNSQVLQFSVRAPTPELAADAANGWAQTYLDRRSQRAEEIVGTTTETLLGRIEAAQQSLKQLGTSTDELDQARREVLVAKISDINKQLVSLGVGSADPGTVISEASPPAQPVAPQLAVSLGAGLILGAALATVLLLIGYARGRPRAATGSTSSERQVRVLASVSGLADNESGLAAEELSRACREVAAFTADPGAIAVVGVADPITTTRAAFHLGQAWASDFGSSVVVATDQSAEAAFPFDAGHDPGLSDLLLDRASPGQCATQVPGTRATVMGPGREPHLDPVPTRKLQTVWDKVGQELGTVVAATVTPGTAIGHAVIHTAGRVVGVVRSGHHREQDLAEILNSLDSQSASDRLAGVVIVDELGPSVVPSTTSPGAIQPEAPSMARSLTEQPHEETRDGDPEPQDARGAS